MIEINKRTKEYQEEYLLLINIEQSKKTIFEFERKSVQSLKELYDAIDFVLNDIYLSATGTEVIQVVEYNNGWRTISKSFEIGDNTYLKIEVHYNALHTTLEKELKIVNYLRNTTLPESINKPTTIKIHNLNLSFYYKFKPYSLRRIEARCDNVIYYSTVDGHYTAEVLSW